MGCEFSIRMTEQAASDLDETLRYISKTLCNPTAAKDFFETLDTMLHRIASFPESGEKAANPAVILSGVRKMPVKNYTVYYYPDINNRILIILRIIYSHRNMDEIIRDLRV